MTKIAYFTLCLVWGCFAGLFFRPLWLALCASAIGATIISVVDYVGREHGGSR